jgi:hypothetical protein
MTTECFILQMRPGAECSFVRPKAEVSQLGIALWGRKRKEVALHGNYRNWVFSVLMFRRSTVTWFLQHLGMAAKRKMKDMFHSFMRMKYKENIWA